MKNNIYDIALFQSHEKVLNFEIKCMNLKYVLHVRVVLRCIVCKIKSLEYFVRRYYLYANSIIHLCIYLKARKFYNSDQNLIT